MRLGVLIVLFIIFGSLTAATYFLGNKNIIDSMPTEVNAVKSKPADARSMAGSKPVVEVIVLKKKLLEKVVHLPGDLLPYEAVDVYAKVSGYIEKLHVDRGSVVKKDDILVQLSVPELEKNIEAANAQFRAANDLYERNEKTGIPIISPLALKASKEAAEVARSNLAALQEQKNYLTVRAPFNGIITTRNLHTGALVIAGGNNGATPVFRLENINTLRLVAAVPEAQVDGIKKGLKTTFTVSAFPNRTFTARVARVSHSLDQRTRTEAVEMDVDNTGHALSPGMYTDVHWPVTGAREGFIIPAKAMAATTEKTFVIRINAGITQWVEVKRGNISGGEVEIFGALKTGDTIAVRATDELKEGIKVDVLPAISPSK